MFAVFAVVVVVVVAVVAIVDLEMQWFAGFVVFAAAVADTDVPLVVVPFAVVGDVAVVGPLVVVQVVKRVAPIIAVVVGVVLLLCGR